MRQLNSPETPLRAAPACPNPLTVLAGSYHINFSSIELGDPAQRTLSGRDLRYWLLHHLNTNSGNHRVADLATTITEAGFLIPGRASKTISDALHTETDRGRVTRTGWGRYAISRPLAATTVWRIKRRVITLNRRLNEIILIAQRAVEQRWRNALSPHGIPTWLTQEASPRRLQAHIFVAPHQKSPAQRDSVKKVLTTLGDTPPVPGFRHLVRLHV